MSEEVASPEAARSEAAPAEPQPRPKGQRPAPPPRAAAAVLAGGKADDAFRAATGVESRALAPVAGRPMVLWVLDALAAAETVDRVVLVGAEALTDAPGVRQRLRGGSDLVETMERGINACPGAARVLLVSADIPALTPAAVDAFVRDGIAADADLVYPVIPRAANEARFPGSRRTYLRLADGVFTGGNMFLVRPEPLLRQREVIRRAHAARKKPLRLAAALGWGVLWRLLWRRLTLAEAEAAVARTMGITVRALVTDHAEIGADVDRAADLDAMSRYLQDHSRQQSP
jgi:2-phospho-L-lactate guanylyltransferase (CobY/MobA/RfbA family)